MAATGVLLLFLGTFAAPVYQRACNVHFPNFQDMFIMLKASLGIFWITLQNQDGRHGGFFDRLFTKSKKCEYLENRKR